MTAVDPSQDPIIHGLEPQFHTDITCAGQLFQDEQGIIGQRVGPGADGDAEDVRMGNGAAIEVAKPCRRRIGVGEISGNR